MYLHCTSNLMLVLDESRMLVASQMISVRWSLNDSFSSSLLPYRSSDKVMG